MQLGAARGLALRTDGNPVLYTSEGHSAVVHSHAWKDTRRTEMQVDGNLVIYAGDRTAVRSIGTHGNPGLYLELGDDASLVIRAAGGSSTLWSR